MAEVMRIVRLQIQLRPVKVGAAPLRRYTTDAVQSVERLQITERGSIGFWRADGTEQHATDVHHQDHPQTRDRKGKGGISVMGSGDYAWLRQKYGAHLADGVAGESVLVDAPEGLAELDFPSEFAIRTTAGSMINFHVGRVADPCVEFSRFCLGEAPSAKVSDAVRQALVDLDDGHRGYRAAATHAGVISIGDELVL